MLKREIKTNPVLLICLGVLAVLGIGYISLKVFGDQSGSDHQVIVKPANPDDPKYKPDPRLGLAGAGSN